MLLCDMLVECAPMAGYTNAEFRRVLCDLGARVVWTEMVSAAAIFYGNKKTLKLLEHEKRDGVKNVVQLFGYNPKHFEFAIKSGVLDGFDEININMGCPANKIVKNKEGVALMTDIEKAKEIIKACIIAGGARGGGHPLPVSVKMRLGKSAGCDYVAFAKMCESAGAARIIVHGRYGDAGYSGVANWDAIGEIVRAVKIPVIANGDIKCVDDARRCLEITGAAGVMVGRGLLPIYKKYFSRELRTLSCDKICRSINPCIDNVIELLRCTE